MDELTITKGKLTQALELASEEGFCCNRQWHRAEAIWWWMENIQVIDNEDPMPDFMLRKLGRI